MLRASNADRPAGGEILDLAVLHARYYETSITGIPGDLERSGSHPAYLRTQRAAAQWHRLRGIGLDEQCGPRSEADTHRHYQQPVEGRELGDSERPGVGPLSDYRRVGTVVGGVGGECDRQQLLLGGHGDLHNLGRLGRLVRPRRAPASAGELRAVGMWLCVWLPRTPDCDLAICESEFHFETAA